MLSAHAAEHDVPHREMDFRVLDFGEVHAGNFEIRMSNSEIQVEVCWTLALTLTLSPEEREQPSDAFEF